MICLAHWSTVSRGYHHSSLLRVPLHRFPSLFPLSTTSCRVLSLIRSATWRANQHQTPWQEERWRQCWQGLGVRCWEWTFWQIESVLLNFQSFEDLKRNNKRCFTHKHLFRCTHKVKCQRRIFHSNHTKSALGYQVQLLQRTTWIILSSE